MTNVSVFKQIFRTIFFVAVFFSLLVGGANSRAEDTPDFDVLIIGCEPGINHNFVVVRSSLEQLMHLQCSKALEKFIGVGKNAFQIEAVTSLFNSGVVYTLIKTERLLADPEK